MALSILVFKALNILGLRKEKEIGSRACKIPICAAIDGPVVLQDFKMTRQ
jgi:hypothetical protein